MHIAEHAGAHFARLLGAKVDVGANGSMQQRLRRPKVVAQRRLGMLGCALHEAAQRVQLQEMAETVEKFCVEYMCSMYML